LRIIVFKFATALGDNVVFLPVIQALRRLNPDWQLTLLVDPSEAELYGGPFAPQELLVDHKERFATAHRRPWELLSWAKKIRRRSPQACILPFDQGNVAHLVALFSGAKVRAGSVDHVRFPGSLTHLVPMPTDACAATWNWAAATAVVGALSSEAKWPTTPPVPDLSHLLPAGHSKVRANGGRKKVVVHPGASGLNCWPADKFAAVAAALSAEFDVTWIRHGNGTVPAPPQSTVAEVGSLTEFAGLLVGADLFLGNNSGPMHFANALGCPGVAVTGPTAFGWNPYWHRERWTVLRHPNLYCAPCEVLNQKVEACANLENPMACLKYWTPDMVAEACRSRLDRQPGRKE
jgi:ADP-heptose:LPS heptosyltransferase